MKLSKTLFLLSMLFAGTALTAQDSIPAYVSNPANDFCFSCHGKRFYTYSNQDSSQLVTHKMFKDLIVDTLAYYNGNHKTLGCTDCHSSEYHTLPHKSDLKLEPMLACTDCHSDTEDVPPINFTGITEEFNKSIHFVRKNARVNCFSCHNPHSYNITTRSDEKLDHAVAYDNSICLECHSGMGKFDILYGDPSATILAKHKWLPNQINHFRSVRCIECHAEIREDVLVAHNILPKEQAVKTCAECHSANSRLKNSLYKFQLAQQRGDKGVLATIVGSESYAIGTNPSPFLNLLSWIILGAVIAGLGIHTLIRIIKK